MMTNSAGPFLRTAVAISCLVVVPGLIASSIEGQQTASAPPVGDVVIEPVASNIAAKFWASVSASSGASSAAAAIDQDPATAWLADGQALPARLTLDLGGAYDNVRRVDVVFPGRGAVYRHLIEASSGDEVWHTIADHSNDTDAARGATAFLTLPGTRFIRVTITGVSPGAPIGISEIRAFNYLRDNLILGADLSNVDGFDTRQYYVHPDPSLENMGAGPHLLDVVKDRGMQYIRLRIFNEPRNERTGEPRTPATQGPARSAIAAQWVTERDLGLGIDFHYADSWADPGKQPKPRAWAELEFGALTTALGDFTYDYIHSLVEQGTVPDKIAIGNEVINGFLWGSESAYTYDSPQDSATANPPYFRDQAAVYQSQPGGRILWNYWRSTDPIEQRRYDESWDRFSTLVATGIAAARRASPESRIEIHTIVGLGDEGRSRLDQTMEFWHQLLTRVRAKGQNPDVLAISYYPEWHGTVDQLDLNLHMIATTYPEYAVEVAETAYPANGGTPQPNAIFPRTPQGQADAIRRVFQAANDVVDNQGLGVLLWEPASFQSMFRPTPGMEGYFEPLPSIDVFTRARARHVLEDTVHLSTRPGVVPALPRTTRVLVTADGSLETEPVVWGSLSASELTMPGTVSVTGSTAFGEVTAIIDVVEGGAGN